VRREHGNQQLDRDRSREEAGEQADGDADGADRLEKNG
jgi:hypothetical protein